MPKTKKTKLYKTHAEAIRTVAALVSATCALVTMIVVVVVR